MKANALAGRAAIVGQIWGSATVDGALSLGVGYTRPAVSAVAAVAVGFSVDMAAKPTT